VTTQLCGSCLPQGHDAARRASRRRCSLRWRASRRRCATRCPSPPARCGAGAAAELALTARRLGAAEAHALRLVSGVHPDAAALRAAAGAAAAAIAARSPLAVAGTKRVLLHSRCAPHAAAVTSDRGRTERMRLLRSPYAASAVPGALCGPVICPASSWPCWPAKVGYLMALRRMNTALHGTALPCSPAQAQQAAPGRTRTDRSVADGLEFVAALNSAQLPSADLQAVFRAVARRELPRFAKL